MSILINPYRGRGLTCLDLLDVPVLSVQADAPQALLSRCPKAGPTPLHSVPDLASRFGVADVFLKDERARMGLGSFKALGAAYVIACDAEAGKARGTTYVTASAGNHGLSVAAGASAFGANAVVFISGQVPQSFAERLTALGADVHRHGANYEESMQAAADMAAREGAVLLSDSSWPGYLDRPHRLMEGYLVLMQEVVETIAAPPSHIFLQAGVGGLAGAVSALARARWGDEPIIVVVEPEYAPALIASIKAGGSVDTHGPVSAMGRLDCKTPSLIALKGLAYDADIFMTVTEAEGQSGADLVAEARLESTPSGAAGIAGLARSDHDRETLRLNVGSRVLAILSEEAQ